jgi:hypothetical protein
MITTPINSSTGKMREFSMSKTTRMRKDKLFKFKKILTQPTRNGRLSMLIKPTRLKQRD